MSGLNHNLHRLPCLDSQEMANRRKQELDISRQLAVDLGKSAVKAAKVGYYLDSTGTKADWSGAVESACKRKRSIPPDEVLPAPDTVATFGATTVQVTNETTLGVAQRMIESGLRPLALNFANGISPGGGFQAT